MSKRKAPDDIYSEDDIRLQRVYCKQGIHRYKRDTTSSVQNGVTIVVSKCIGCPHEAPTFRTSNLEF